MKLRVYSAMCSEHLPTAAELADPFRMTAGNMRRYLVDLADARLIAGAGDG